MALSGCNREEAEKRLMLFCLEAAALLSAEAVSRNHDALCHRCSPSWTAAILKLSNDG